MFESDSVIIFLNSVMVDHVEQYNGKHCLRISLKEG